MISKDVRTVILKGLALPQKACCSNLHKTMRGEQQEANKKDFIVEDHGCIQCFEEVVECKRCERTFCKWCDLANLDFPSKYNGLVCPVCEVRMQCERLAKECGGGGAPPMPIVQDVSIPIVQDVSIPIVEDVSIVEGQVGGSPKHKLSPDLNAMNDRKRSKVVGEAVPWLEDGLPIGPLKVSPYKEPHDAKKQATKELKRELKHKASVEIKKALAEYKSERRHTITGAGSRKPSMIARKESLLGRKQSIAEGAASRKPSIALGRTQSLDQERRASVEARQLGRSMSLLPPASGGRKHSMADVGGGGRKNSTAQIQRSNSLVAKLYKSHADEPEFPPSPPARKCLPHEELLQQEKYPKQEEAGEPEPVRFPLKPLDNQSHVNQRAGDKFAANLAKAGTGAGVEARVNALRRVSQIEEPSVASPTAADGLCTARSRMDAVTACEVMDLNGNLTARARGVRA